MSFFSTDIGVILSFKIKDETGEFVALDSLTDSVELHVSESARSPFTCTIFDGPNGQVTYQVLPGDFPPGNHISQLVLTMGDDEFRTNSFTLNVKRPEI